MALEDIVQGRRGYNLPPGVSDQILAILRESPHPAAHIFATMEEQPAGPMTEGFDFLAEGSSRVGVSSVQPTVTPSSANASLQSQRSAHHTRGEASSSKSAPPVLHAAAAHLIDLLGSAHHQAQVRKQTKDALTGDESFGEIMQSSRWQTWQSKLAKFYSPIQFQMIFGIINATPVSYRLPAVLYAPQE